MSDTVEIDSAYLQMEFFLNVLITVALLTKVKIHSLLKIAATDVQSTPVSSSSYCDTNAPAFNGKVGINTEFIFSFLSVCCLCIS